MNQIGSAQQMSQGVVQVFDTRGSFLYQKMGTLVGYTSTTVTVLANNGCHQTFGLHGEFLFQR